MSVIIYEEASLRHAPMAASHVAVCAKSNTALQGSFRVFRPSLLRLLCIEDGCLPIVSPKGVWESWIRCLVDEQRENLDLGLKLDKPYDAFTPK